MKNINIKLASSILVPKPISIENKIGIFEFSCNLKIKENLHFNKIVNILNKQFNLKGTDEKIVLLENPLF